MRPLRAIVDLGVLRRNYEILRTRQGDATLAVIKADAYGHGAIPAARSLEARGADGFAVAYLDEALRLRSAGIKKPVVILDGVFSADEYDEIEDKDLWPVINDERQLEWFLARSWKKPARVWLKMDSGMRRAGFSPDEFPKAHKRLMDSGKVADVVSMTHLCKADVPGDEFTKSQLSAYMAAVRNLPGGRSVANSAGMIYHPESRLGWGRAGISLYGYDPYGEGDPELAPVMTLQSRVIDVRPLKKGEGVGYGLVHVAKKDERVGLVPCGYADGYPRRSSDGNPVAVDGLPSRVLGRVCMDLMMVEMPPGTGVGATVELWGPKVSLDELCRRAETIPHDPLTHLKRAELVYVNG